MADVVTLPSRDFVLGEHKNIGFQNLRLKTGAALSGVSATVTIKDSSGSQTLAATTVTISGSGTKRNAGAYLLTTGSGGTITIAGTYRAIYTVTYGGEIQIWMQVIEVKANPF